jgi:hypothetical protein
LAGDCPVQRSQATFVRGGQGPPRAVEPVMMMMMMMILILPPENKTSRYTETMGKLQ